MNSNYLVYAVYYLDREKNCYRYLKSYPHLNAAKAYCDMLRDKKGPWEDYFLIRCFSLEKGPVSNTLYHGGLLDKQGLKAYAEEFITEGSEGFICRKLK